MAKKKSDWMQGLMFCEDMIDSFGCEYALDYYYREIFCNRDVDIEEFCIGYLERLKHEKEVLNGIK